MFLPNLLALLQKMVIIMHGIPSILQQPLADNDCFTKCIIVQPNTHSPMCMSGVLYALSYHTYSSYISRTSLKFSCFSVWKLMSRAPFVGDSACFHHNLDLQTFIFNKLIKMHFSLVYFTVSNANRIIVFESTAFNNTTITVKEQAI